MATILVVDDQPDNREFLVTLLGYAGHRMLEASDGAEALALVRTQRPDLVISDILMPTMNGYEFVRQIRSDPAIAAVPVVLSSAHFEDTEAAALAKACGVSFLLSKPCDPADVVQTVNAALAAERSPPPPPDEEAFDREHLRLLADQLARKVEALQAANERLTRETEERRAAETMLMTSEQRLRAVVETAVDAIVTIDEDGVVHSFNPAAERIFGYEASEVVGRNVGLLMPEIFRTRHDACVAAYCRTGAAKVIGVGREVEAQRKNGEIFPVDLAVAEWSVAGKRFFTGTMRDITARRQAEEHVRFVMRELSHRTKNVLAVVQAMAWQTARTSPDLEGFKERFGRRIEGFSRSHDLLTKSEWRGVSLDELVRGHLHPFLDKPEARLDARGPEVVLTPEAAQNLGLALHELATNASKYGALSHPAGRIEVGWRVDSEAMAPPRFHMSWRETCGHEVFPPKRSGFGHAVIKDMTAKALHGKVMLEFPPQGLVWRLTAPTDGMFWNGEGSMNNG